MHWNWELPAWPQFTYDTTQISQKERKFLLDVGNASGFLKNIGSAEYHQFVVEILSSEGLESSKIEGEILDIESLQSSIKKCFGLKTLEKTGSKKEAQMANVLCNVYESYEQPLSHEMLWKWYASLFDEQLSLSDLGKYRTHPEPMQIVSNRYDKPKVFFEAPPSKIIPNEMKRYLTWFNSTSEDPILVRAAIAHLYFESIHPFEDGNGRIGRLLVEKVLSQGVKQPILIAVSKVLEKRKNEYYTALERCNRTLEIGHWVDFFSDVILQAQEESMALLDFLIKKSKMLTMLAGQLNLRQEKVLLRMFAEGPSGFQGGLSAEKYISITKASRATATRDLLDLVQKNALTKTGELRHTRYWLNLS